MFGVNDSPSIGLITSGERCDGKVKIMDDGVTDYERPRRGQVTERGDTRQLSFWVGKTRKGSQKLMVNWVDDEWR